jgi:hypothetical protein
LVTSGPKSALASVDGADLQAFDARHQPVHQAGRRCPCRPGTATEIAMQRSPAEP